MRKIITGVLFLILFGSLSVFAKPKRIVFKKGATKTVAAGSLRNYKDSADYVIWLRAGQTFEISSDKSITLTILDPAGEDVTDRDLSCNGSKTIAPTVAGDYKITVVECPKADQWRGSFNLNISVK